MLLEKIRKITSKKSESGEEKEKKNFFVTMKDNFIKQPKKRKQQIVFASVAVFLVAGILITTLGVGGQSSAQSNTEYINYTVEKRDITLTLSGTGSLSPADSYTVTSLIEGNILSAPFEEGDIIEKDSMLYRIDSSDVANSIEQSEIALAQTQRNHNQKIKSLDDLKVKSDVAGEVLDIAVEVGDNVTVGQTIASIRNSSIMSLVIPFGSDDAAGFYVGQSAEVTLDGTFERLTGTISKISGVEERLDGNMLVRSVTIDVQNPGGIASGQAATAMVGDIACNGSGTFSYKGESTLTATVSGKVSAVHVKEGDHVSKNQLVVTLNNDSLENDVANSSGSLRDSELSLKNRYDQLDNYTITSPISGTIIEKYYKEGDTLESGKTLCTIFDLSYLTMTLNVDELDISQVEVGQRVTITVEALSGQTFEGYVTKVNINGASNNGVTSYPVEIRIDETDGLLPGMNVEAEIVVSSKSDVLAVPVSALSRGNRVLVKTDSTDKAEETKGLPEGFAYVEVTPGISDGSYIEIISGLEEGDEVAYIEMIKEGSEFMILEGDSVSLPQVRQSDGMSVPSSGPSNGMGGGF